MNILSLFDGISVAQQAIKNCGITIEKYYSSEIDKYAIQITTKNFPNTIQLGDVRCVGEYKIKDIDLLIGGSPCQDLSIAKKNREGLKGSRSSLFYEYVKILKEIKPKYFVLENVNSMPKEAKEIITRELFNIEPIMINASLVSAQNRKRLFWIGKLVNDKYEQVNIELPEDRGILLKDILEENVDEKYILSNREIEYMNGDSGKYSNRWSFCNDESKKKSLTLVSNLYKGVPYNTLRVGEIGNGGQGERVYSTDGKSVSLSANGGGGGAKTGLYAIIQRPRGNNNGNLYIHKSPTLTSNSFEQNNKLLKDSIIRKLTPIECERLQSLPDNYTKGISDTQRYKSLGNAFNCAVIEHIIKNIF